MLEFPERARVLCRSPRQKPGHQNSASTVGLGAGGTRRKERKRWEEKEKEGKEKRKKREACLAENSGIYGFSQAHQVFRSKTNSRAHWSACWVSTGRKPMTRGLVCKFEGIGTYIESISDPNSEKQWAGGWLALMEGAVSTWWVCCRKSHSKPLSLYLYLKMSRQEIMISVIKFCREKEQGTWLPMALQL